MVAVGVGNEGALARVTRVEVKIRIADFQIVGPFEHAEL
jgi:hypothetical protein